MDKKQNKQYKKSGYMPSKAYSKFDSQGNSNTSKSQLGHNDSESFDNELSVVEDVNEIIKSNQRRNSNDQQSQASCSSNKVSAPFDLRDTLKYHDLDSYESQRSHKIGEGLFITDDISDLPPRYKKKVLKVIDEIQVQHQQMINDLNQKYAELNALSKAANLPSNSCLPSDGKNQIEQIKKASRNDQSVSRKKLSEDKDNENYLRKSKHNERVSNYIEKDNTSVHNFNSTENVNSDQDISKCKARHKPFNKYNKNERTKYGELNAVSNAANLPSNSRVPSDEKNQIEQIKKVSCNDQSVSGKKLSEDKYNEDYRKKSKHNEKVSNYIKKDNTSVHSFNSTESVNSDEDISNTKVRHKPFTKHNKNERAKYAELNAVSNAANLPSNSRLPSDRKNQIEQIKKVSSDQPVSGKKLRTEDKDNENYLRKSKHNVRVSNYMEKDNTSVHSFNSTESVSSHQNISNTKVRHKPFNKYNKNERTKYGELNAISNAANLPSNSCLPSDGKNQVEQIKKVSSNDQYVSGKKLRTEDKDNESYPRKSKHNERVLNYIENDNTSVHSFNSTESVSSHQNISKSQVRHKPFDKCNKNERTKYAGLNAISNAANLASNSRLPSDGKNQIELIKKVSSNDQYVSGKKLRTEDKDNENYPRKSKHNERVSNYIEKDNTSVHSFNSAESVSSDQNISESKVRHKPFNKYSKNDREIHNSDFPFRSHEIKLSRESIDSFKDNDYSVENQKCLKSVNTRSHLSTLGSDALNFIYEVNRLKSTEEEQVKPFDANEFKSIKKIKDVGFFIHVTVSEDSSNLEMWQSFFIKLLKFNDFDIDTCCKFTESLILCFHYKTDSQKAYTVLNKSKVKNKDIRKPHIISISKVKYHLLKPCTCGQEIIENCRQYFKDLSKSYIRQHNNKIAGVLNELQSVKSRKCGEFLKEHILGLQDALNTLEDMRHVFNKYVEETMTKVEGIRAMSDLRKLKIDFSRECNTLAKCLPIYSRKDVILETVRFNQVSVIVAETGSGKSTQLAEYLLQLMSSEGTVICTQPRKIAAISITQYVSGQIGSAVGKEIGYDVGIEKKYFPTTKIIYMTDYALLRKCLRNKRLKGVSCVIIDEAHERTLYTDLLLGLLKQCLPSRPDLRVVITSATIDPRVFVDYFDLPPSAVVNVPGRTYPVEVMWLKDDVDDNFKYVEECVKTALDIHLNEPKDANSDILVFLTSPAEIDEAILLFKEMCYEKDRPQLMSLHGKSDVQEQMLVFQTSLNHTRRIIFATNSAETSLTIPGIKYVVDSGMTKEMLFYPEKNKSCLIPKLINKSSAEQRKGRAGRTQPGVCFRLYSKKNYENMPERSLPEMLKTNLLSALLKVYEFGINPDEFDFVESPSKEAIERSLDSLEMLDLVKENKLTQLGQQVVKLSIEPRLAKFVLSGVECGIGHEAAIIAALVSEAGRLFIRFDDNKSAADEKKKAFCKESGDLCTFLEVYKRWLEVRKPERFDWCVANYISSKALTSSAKTVKEIIMSLKLDLDISVSKKYNNLAFKSNFERILFNSFSENLCVFSGHPSLGYFSPYFKESLFIHPSSSLKRLHKACPKFLVYTTLMETSRNFILDVTPLKEETVTKAYLSGNFMLTVDCIMKLQICPLVLGPFGEKILSRHIIGKKGLVISNLELLIERLTKTRNFRIDIDRGKAKIIVYVESRFHEKISNFFREVVNEAVTVMAKEEKVEKKKNYYLCLSMGGVIHEIIMPGEFRNLNVETSDKRKLEEIKCLLENIGSVQSIDCTQKLVKGKFLTNVTYRTVAEAEKALAVLNKERINVRAEYETLKTNKSTNSLYKLKLSWTRLFCKGTGYISFFKPEDLTLVSGRLTANPVSIGDKTITIRPSTYRDLELDVKGLPPITNEQMLRDALNRTLIDRKTGLDLYKLIRDVHIDRVGSQPVVESDIVKKRDLLMKQFCRFISPSKVFVDIKYPKPFDTTWEAWVFFENVEDVKDAFQKLDGEIELDSVPVEMTEILETEIQCKRDVYKFLKENIVRLIARHDGKLISNQIVSNSENVSIKFSCGTIENLCKTRKEILKLIEGKRIGCCFKKKYFYLFTDTAKKKLKDLEVATNTLILTNVEKRTLFIYGDVNDCNKAESAIHEYVESESKKSGEKGYDLKSTQMPPGFLRYIYGKYGMDLFHLVKQFNLRNAQVDKEKGLLIIKGQSSFLKKVEDHLESICVELYGKNPYKNIPEDTEICAICLDPINFDFYRLEHCGHAFCKGCLVLQLESNVFPVACAHENCRKELLLTDIEKICSFGGRNFKDEFIKGAFQYFVSTNSSKISYCPTPDCDGVYRISSKSESEFHCPECEFDICTHCQTYSHKGLTCEMFQNSKIDEDYSLKVWMRSDPSNRKPCPNCKTVIEKIEGCNHMECFKCHSHFCWLCLKAFADGDLVYAHLPYCPKNQG